MNNLKFDMEKISIILEDKLGQGTSFPTESLNIKVTHILIQYLLRPGIHQVS